MPDAVLLAVLSVAGDLLKGLATTVVLELRERHRSGERGEVTADQLRQAIDRTRNRLAELHQGELRQVPAHEWEAAMQAARTSLTGAGVDLALIFEAELDPVRLARIVEARGEATLQRAGLGDGGAAVYHQMITLTSHQLIAFSRSLPDFERVLQTRTFWQVGDVARQLDALLQSRRSEVRVEDSAFAARLQTEPEQPGDMILKDGTGLGHGPHLDSNNDFPKGEKRSSSPTTGIDDGNFQVPGCRSKG